MSFFKYFMGIPVLTYHKVCNDFEIGITSVSKLNFYKQMSYLKENGYQSILPSQYKKIQHNRKRVIISFDDAYENVFDNALPIMQDFGFVGLIFPIYNYIGKLNNWDANLGGIKFKHASKEQLNEMINCGWEIGSHSLNHQTYLKSQNIADELIASKQKLEKMFLQKVQSFSYPFGRSLNKYKSLVRSNYNFAFSGQMHSVIDEYQISRSTVYRTDTVQNLQNKLDAQYLESIKLALIHKGAFATEIYQKIS